MKPQEDDSINIMGQNNKTNPHQVQVVGKVGMSHSSKDSKDTKRIKDQYNETNGHKIARFLQRFNFYFPSAQQKPIVIPGNEEHGQPSRTIEPPSLEEAWRFFEYHSLPRRFVNIYDSGKGRKYCRAGAGEKEQPTKLYPVIDTPQEDMADFGIGVGMYFKTVRFFCIVTFIAGCLSIPSMLYYDSTEYSSDGKTSISHFLNRFSAVCTNTKFQPCPTCTRDDWPSFPPTDGRVLFTKNDEMAFIMVNQCQLNDVLGYFSLGTMIFVICSVYLFVHLQRRYRIMLDEGEQTSSDYSIQIKVSLLLHSLFFSSLSLFIVFSSRNNHVI
jgi:hypothetical protein